MDGSLHLALFISTFPAPVQIDIFIVVPVAMKATRQKDKWYNILQFWWIVVRLFAVKFLARAVVLASHQTTARRWLFQSLVASIVFWQSFYKVRIRRTRLESSWTKRINYGFVTSTKGLHPQSASWEADIGHDRPLRLK